MKDRTLADELQLLVSRYGIDKVDVELQRLVARQPTSVKRTKPKPNGDMSKKARRPRARVKAPEYVAKMDIEGDRVATLLALAERFEAKSFLPRCADIRNFCHIYGIDEPASKSRAGAIPRLFKYLATMDANDIQGLLDEHAFSGPARLGPLADAIREHGRAARGLNAAREASGTFGGEPPLPQDNAGVS